MVFLNEIGLRYGQLTTEPNSVSFFSFILIFSYFFIDVQAKQKKFTFKDNIIIGSPEHYKEKDGISKLTLDSLTKYPDFIGQINVNTGENTTFAEIRERSIRCALWLQKNGIGKNDVVVVSTFQQSDDVVPTLATLFVGAIFNPWNRDVSPDVAQSYFKEMQPKIVFADKKSINILYKAAKKTKVNCKFVIIGSHRKFQSLRGLMAQQTQEEVDSFKHVEPKDPTRQIGIVYYSSGTSGKQKSIMLSYDTLLKHHLDYLPMEPGMNALLYSSLAWITGTSLTTTFLRARITRIIHEEFDPQKTSEVIQNYRVNFVLVSPTTLTRLYKEKAYSRYDFSSVKTFVTIGSKPSKTVLEETRRALPNVVVSNAYGSTELGGIVTMQTKKFTRSDSIGYIIEGIKMKVFDQKTGRSLGPNQEGELCFKLNSIMLGYWKNPNRTNKVIDKEGWVHTDDLGFYDESGEISITDRVVITTKNHRVSPSEIEDILIQHPGVADVAVVPVPNKNDGERPIAFVVKTPGAEVTAEELRDLPASKNEYFRLTGGVVFLDKIPLTLSGKKNLSELKEMAKAYEE